MRLNFRSSLLQRQPIPVIRNQSAAIFSLLVSLSIFMPPASAASVEEENKAANPPLFPNSATSCQASFKLKPAFVGDHHGFVVIKGPDGKLLELRGGPSNGGSGASVPGAPSSGDQPPGNPFNCTTPHQWGVVVPYVGKHGNLGTDSGGTPIYSPDGRSAEHVFNVSIGRGAQPNICAMANCMMTIIKTMGASCKNYTAGTGRLRNSNTLISLALSSCGVPDPLPSPMTATGWGETWEQ